MIREEIIAIQKPYIPQAGESQHAEYWEYQRGFVVDKILSLRLDCPECGGTLAGMPTLDAPDGYPCKKCQGTGKSKVTLGDIVKLWEERKLLVEDEDQSLPNSYDVYSAQPMYAKAQQDMLHAGFKRVKKVGE